MHASSSACMAPTFRSGSGSGFGGDDPCLAAFPCVKACSCSLFATSSDASARSFCSGEGRGGESSTCCGMGGSGPGLQTRLQLEEEGKVLDARVQEAVHQLGLAKGLELVCDLVRERREHHGCQDVAVRARAWRWRGRWVGVAVDQRPRRRTFIAVEALRP